MSPLKIVLAAVMLLLVSQASAAANATDPPVEDPATLGFSRNGLDELTKAFDEFIDDGEIAGMVGLIARDGKLVYHEALGMRNREEGVPMTADTIFFIASLTKIVTSAAAMILTEEGKLGLDDPVTSYLPNFKNLKVLEREGDEWKEVEPRRPMTVRHLHTHTAGLTYGWTGDRVDQILYERGVTKGNRTIGDMVGKLDRAPLRYHPGEVWEYSFATDVLGRVIEVASGRTLAGFFKERIFDPLGMNDTAFDAKTLDTSRIAAGYKLEDGKAVPNEKPWWRAKEGDGPLTYFSGGGGLASTAHDYFVFMQMLLGRGEYGGVRILSRKSVKAMTRNQIEGVKISKKFPWTRRFGLGLTIDGAPDGKGVCYRWGGATGTTSWFNVKKKMVGVFMIHIGDQKFNRRFYDLAHRALLK